MYYINILIYCVYVNAYLICIEFDSRLVKQGILNRNVTALSPHRMDVETPMQNLHPGVGDLAWLT